MTAEPVHFEVCFESREWVRPTDAVQGKIWRDRRYQGAKGQRVPLAKYCFTHQFFVFGDPSASIEHLFRSLSGLWTATDLEQRCTDAVLAGLRKGRGAELWILNHRVTRIEDGTPHHVVHVEPTTAGFQIVLVPRKAGAHLAFRFVDQTGHPLATVDERLTIEVVKAESH